MLGIAKNNLFVIWIKKHYPNNDPKFHQDDLLNEAGKSTKAVLAISSKGCST